MVSSSPVWLPGDWPIAMGDYKLGISWWRFVISIECHRTNRNVDHRAPLVELIMSIQLHRSRRYFPTLWHIGGQSSRHCSYLMINNTAKWIDNLHRSYTNLHWWHILALNYQHLSLKDFLSKNFTLGPMCKLVIKIGWLANASTITQL